MRGDFDIVNDYCKLLTARKGYQFVSLSIVTYKKDHIICTVRGLKDGKIELLTFENSRYDLYNYELESILLKDETF